MTSSSLTSSVVSSTYALRRLPASMSCPSPSAEKVSRKASLFALLAWLSFFTASCAPYGTSSASSSLPTLTIQEFDDLRYPFTMKYAPLTVRGHAVRLAYSDEGSPTAPVIVFIHGLGSYAPAWKRNIEALRTQYRCIAIDLPGYGKSSKNPQDITTLTTSTVLPASYPYAVYPYSMNFYAETVAALLSHLNIRQATLCGHSMGGQISMTTALRFPDRVQRLILVDPAGFEGFSEGEKQWFREVITQSSVRLTPPAQIRSNLAGNFYDFDAVASEAEFMITDRIAMRSARGFDQYCYAIVKSVQAMVDEPVIDYLHRIKQPTLVLFGENDNLIPNPFLHAGFSATVAQSGASKLPNATLVMIPQAGHFAQFEKPEVVNQAIRTFLQ